MKSALKKVSLILAICFVAFHLYTAAFGTMPGIAQKSIHLGFLLVIFYINAMVDSEKRWEQIFLGIMALFALGGCAYITILDENLQLRAGIVYASDILFAILLIIAIFEACRRKMGNPLVIITLVFVAYAFLGKYIPGFLNQPGMTLKKFTSLVYLTTDGIFGSPLYASASYVIIFVLLGAIARRLRHRRLYDQSGHSPCSATCAAAPPKVAVVASGFFGSISGSPRPMSSAPALSPFL
ncbi:MAG: hypothetical protein ACLR0P_06920 [Oscillospiraceae bacterium]